ncbi:Glycosyl transferase family 2 [Nocardioides exalbidus]|uniref:Glycosyl transferase family 2 n=1 Tax=Nocardioides exalbidus TaxID=402596 RepID=A0A1H4JER4_9ACTN|nr:glycosyltransferase [Nocardioides exalbidus]SEB44814.1 Glycosyl transferase family 2 [Nocardioides exalbidus]
MPESPAGPALRVSVAMATYNGARHVAEQLASILEQLAPHDEVVVVDDASTDDTRDVLASVTDPRVRVVESPVNRGYVRTFEAAIVETTGDVVLLSDQDDVWLPGRRDAMVEALRDHQVVATNLTTLGGPDALQGPFGQADWRLGPRDDRRRWANLLGIIAGLRPYYGCAMGVRRDALEVVLPFPDHLVESHDLWLATYGNLAGTIAHLDQRTVARRLHDDNATPTRPRGPRAVLVSRARLVRVLVDLAGRVRRARRTDRAR